MIVLEIVGFAVVRQRLPVLLLRPVDRRLSGVVPILTSVADAGAILAAAASGAPETPRDAGRRDGLLIPLGMEVAEVAIVAGDDGRHVARVVLSTGVGVTRTVTTRPTEAVALATEAGAPILIAAEIFDEVAIEDADADWYGADDLAPPLQDGDEPFVLRFQEFLDDVQPWDFRDWRHGSAGGVGVRSPARPSARRAGGRRSGPGSGTPASG